MRKSTSFFLLLTCLTLLFSCKKDKTDGPGFDLLIQRDFEVPAGISPFQVHHFILRDVSTNFKTLLQQAGKTEADITGVVNTTGELSAAFGDASLDFIERISVKAFIPDDENDKLEAAYRDPAPFDTGNTLGLIPSLADLKKYLKEPTVSFDVIIFTRYTTQETIPTRLDLRFRASIAE